MFQDLFIIIILGIVLKQLKNKTPVLLKDANMNAHIFENFNYDRLNNNEQACVASSIKHILVLFIVLVTFIIFRRDSFSFLSFPSLVAFVTLFDLLCISKGISCLEKGVSVGVFVAYIATDTPHVRTLLIYHLFSIIQHIIFIDEFLFNRSLENYYSKLLKIEVILFVTFWVFSFVLFTLIPNGIDAFVIPVSFYYQITNWKMFRLSNKKNI